MAEKKIAEMSKDEGAAWIRGAPTASEMDARRERFFLHWLPLLRKQSEDKSAEAIERPTSIKLRNEAAAASRDRIEYSFLDSDFQFEIEQRRTKERAAESALA